MTTCQASKKTSWKLLTVRGTYVPFMSRHVATLLWEYTIECSGECAEGKICLPVNRTGRVSERWNIISGRNKDIPPADKQALKSCYQASKKNFLPCAAALGFGIRDLLKPEILAGPPTYNEVGDCWCYKTGTVTYESDVHTDFKRDQKDEKEFWKQLILDPPDSW